MELATHGVLTSAFLVAVGCTLASPSTASGQLTVVDEGVFAILYDGVEVGTEEFLIRRSGPIGSGTLSSTATVTLDFPDGPQQMFNRLRVENGMAEYQNRLTGGPIQSVRVGPAGRHFVALITSVEGVREREIPADGGSVILDQGVAHHYHFLAQRTERTGEVIPVIIPQTGRHLSLTVGEVTTVPFQLGSESLMARRAVLNPDDGSEGIEVWFGPSGKLLQVGVPARQYRAVRRPS